MRKTKKRESHNISKKVDGTFFRADEKQQDIGLAPRGNILNINKVTDPIYLIDEEAEPDAELISLLEEPEDIEPDLLFKTDLDTKAALDLHCSGAHSVDIIEAARKLGASTGCFHPLQTFAGVDRAIDNLPGTTFAIEAEEPLLTILKDMAAALNGNWVILRSQDKVLYHTAAVFACNYLVTLVKLSTDLWQELGISKEIAIKALMPLLKGTLSNIENIGLPNCLTGPIARGDTGTIQKHLDTLEQRAPSVLQSYIMLGLQTIPISSAKGKISLEKADELKTLFNTTNEKSEELKPALH